MVREKVLDTIKKHNLIQKDQHIVIGLSGGPDSVCLFHILLHLAPDMNLTLYPVHINHRFRPGDAEKDQAYVEKLCYDSGFPCRTFVFDCTAIAKQEKITSEEAGRKVRYQAFARVAEEIAASGISREQIRIAVAQNADDQAETVLFRILRGSGIEGICGIHYQRTDSFGNFIIRPLLDVYKEEILRYCSEYGLSPCIDKTNLEPVYTRNKIRLELIPLLQENYNPSIKDALLRLSRAAAADEACLHQLAREAFDKALVSQTESELIFNGRCLQNLQPALRQRVFSLAFIQLGLSENVGAVHFAACDKILFHESPSARADLPGGYYLTRVYENIKVAAPRQEMGRRLKIRLLSLEAYRALNLPKDSHAAFDYEALQADLGEKVMENICLRTRKAGDVIAIAGGKTKKLQNFFVDQKIPKDLRDHLLLVANGSQILWIPPFGIRGRYSAKYKLCTDTKTAICIEIIC